MIKNTAGQKVTLFAFDASTGLPKTGDAANITAYVAIDGGAVTVLADTSASERDSTNAKGEYMFDVSQAETNGNDLYFSGKSSTANVVIVPMRVQTTLAIVDANVTTIANNAITAAAIATGAIDADAIADDAIDAGAVKADAVTKIQNGLATPTNITAGTITTVTNLTNAPTAGDLTATMKTSVTTAATAATPALSAAGVANIWAALTSGLTTAGSIGKRIVDYLTGDAYARLGAPVGASISADIAAIEAQTDDIGTDGAGLSAVPWNVAWDAEVQSEVTDALNAYDPPTKTEMDSAIQAHLDAITTGTGVKVASMAVDAITASSLAATATAEIADAVLDEVVLGSYTLRQLIRALVASQIGDVSGAATNEITITKVGSAAAAIVATVDADGNRTVTSLDLT